MRFKTGAVIAIVIIFILAFLTTQLGDNSPQPNRSQSTQVIETGLNVPWGLEFLPSGDMLVTQRNGDLLRINQEQGSRQTYTIEGVEHRGEGGLLGIEAHPNFSENKRIYLYMTTREGDMLRNRVMSYRLDNNSLSQPQTLIDGLPGAIYHDGGRIEFGPDRKLYITAGDATNPEWAQDRSVLAGKILRVNPDGSIPEENPFNSSVYSYGHRNPQGLAWEGNTLWATEHGDRARDELNRINKGQNYGWPDIEGDESSPDKVSPVAHSGSNTWAPAGTVYSNGSIFFAGLRGATLYEAELENDSVNIEKHLENQFGRLRAVEKFNGSIYVTTSNRDGRGIPRPGDDKIIKLKLE